MIRILTAESELYASLARICCRSKLWQHGADHLSHSVKRILEAQVLADSEISRHYQQQQQQQQEQSNDTNTTLLSNLEQLKEDARIVEVAVTTLTRERDEYITKAKQQEKYLLDKLAPQWASRDAARERLGADRWTNNPNSTGYYAKLRKDFERQLRDVRQALQELMTMDTTCTTLQANTKRLKDRLAGKQPSTAEPTIVSVDAGTIPLDIVGGVENNMNHNEYYISMITP